MVLLSTGGSSRSPTDPDNVTEVTSLGCCLMGSHESADHCDLREIARQLSQSAGLVAAPWSQRYSLEAVACGLSPTPEQQLDPYGIWTVEVMLQQTQLAVVLPY